MGSDLLDRERCESQARLNFAHSKKKVGRPSTAGQMEMSDDEDEQVAMLQPFDVDVASAADAQACAEMAPEVYRYLHEAQRRHVVQADYLALHQTDITSNMTGILLDWLVEVAEE